MGLAVWVPNATCMPEALHKSSLCSAVPSALCLQILTPPVGTEPSTEQQRKKAALNRQAREIEGVMVPMLLCTDSAYPCTAHILPAFKHHLTSNREVRCFNFRHALTRGAIERAYGRLKMRFRVLLTRPEQDLKNVVLIIGACCVLHNVCELRGCSMPAFDAGFLQLVADYCACFPQEQQRLMSAVQQQQQRSNRQAAEGHGQEGDAMGEEEGVEGGDGEAQAEADAAPAGMQSASTVSGVGIRNAIKKYVLSE